MSDDQKNNQNIEIMSLSSGDEFPLIPYVKEAKNIPKKKDRRRKYDKRISMKKKKLLKEKKFFQQHDDVMNTHIPYGIEANASPHIVVNQWFHRIKNNSIVLKLVSEDHTSKHRKIFYQIDSIGDNVKLVKKKSFIKLNVERTKNNKVFIVLKFKDALEIDKLSYFTETGNLIDRDKYEANTKGYVLLATIQSEPFLRTKSDSFTRDDMLIAKKFLQNQTQSSKTDYHFGTTGNIYGFGYGPVYTSNKDTQYSIDRFAKSKFVCKLIFYWIYNLLINYFTFFPKNQQRKRHRTKMKII